MTVNAMNDGPIKNGSKDAASSHIALTVAAAFFMETLDATIIVTALPAIGIGFGISTLDASLSVTVYLIAMACSSLRPAGAPNDSALAAYCGGCFHVHGSLATVRARTRLQRSSLQGSFRVLRPPSCRPSVVWSCCERRPSSASSKPSRRHVARPDRPCDRAAAGRAYRHARVLAVDFLLNVPLGLTGLWLIWRLFPHHTLRIPFDFRDSPSPR
jgi:hypothetical protein